MDRRQRWERATTFPLIALGVAFVVCYVTVILVVGEPAWVSVLLTAVILVSWAAFIVDVVVRVVLTPKGRRWEFVRNQSRSRPRRSSRTDHPSPPTRPDAARPPPEP